jgi:hypothetical protein
LAPIAAEHENSNDQPRKNDYDVDARELSGAKSKSVRPEIDEARSDHIAHANEVIACGYRIHRSPATK